MQSKAKRGGPEEQDCVTKSNFYSQIVSLQSKCNATQPKLARCKSDFPICPLIKTSILQSTNSQWNKHQKNKNPYKEYSSNAKFWPTFDYFDP